MNTPEHSTETSSLLPALSPEEETNWQNTVLQFIDEKIRPMLAMDGGDITVHEFRKQDNNQYALLVQLVGACGCCPSAAMTLKMGVERLLLHNFERVSSVIPV